jgi:hypothetical protein
MGKEPEKLKTNALEETKRIMERLAKMPPKPHKDEPRRPTIQKKGRPKAARS